MNSSKTIKLFLVDDDSFFSDALKHYLSEGNHKLQTEQFYTGEACLMHLNQKPDIVILDYYLNSSVPDAINGTVVLKKIRETLPEVPVIMLSAQDSITVATEILQSGAYDYISKSESAFVRLENSIANIIKNIKAARVTDKKLKIYKMFPVIFVIVLVVLYVFSRII